MPDVSMELMESVLPLLFITKCERPQLCGNVDRWTVSMTDFEPVDVIYAFKHVEMIQECGLPIELPESAFMRDTFAGSFDSPSVPVPYTQGASCSLRKTEGEGIAYATLFAALILI